MFTSDIDEGRLNKAKELGADFTIKVDTTKDSRDLADKIIDSMGPADQTIECSGAESSFHAAIYVSQIIVNYLYCKFSSSSLVNMYFPHKP